MDFEFIPIKRNIEEKEILADIKRVASDLCQEKLTLNEYKKYGKFNSSTAIRKFGTWNKALLEANLNVSNQLYITEERLFKNILKLWEYLGRQPRRAELELPISDFSQSPYNRTFKNWSNALACFVNWIGQEGIEVKEMNTYDVSKNKKTTSRDPSLRLRFRVLKRDNFRCVQCGASPAKDPSVELHIDHIKPWSIGGETNFDNLQTLCTKCNYGKSNLE